MAQVDSVAGDTGRPCCSFAISASLLCHSREEALNHENPQIVRTGGPGRSSSPGVASGFLGSSLLIIAGGRYALSLEGSEHSGSSVSPAQ